jgi:transglutaminase-like putative cysteine protease
MVVLVATAACIIAGLVTGLPRLAVRIERHITAMFGGEGDEATAFSTTMVLGATRGMLLSDTIVMRIDGEHPEYLRGAVYDRYDGRHWIASGAARDRTAVPAAAPRDAATTRITLVRGAPNGNDMRWFLPPGACDFTVASGSVDVDAFGVARRVRGDDPPTFAYRTSHCSSPAPAVAAPSMTDTDVRNDFRRTLAPIAAAWTTGVTTDREKLNAIKRELGRFEYSLAVPRTRGMDPVLDFLTVHRAGHCEMFASAMVLLARTQGIPARVVGGYRVSEVNPLTGRAVVRDRNAHAWVEAWVDGKWHGFDPTPVGESVGQTTSTFDNLGDIASNAFDRVASAIAALGALGTVAVLIALIAFLLAVRSIGGRLRTRRARRSIKEASIPPLPCFESLTDALATAGHERPASEPVEAFARRVAELGAPWALDASKALLGYAGLRYGGIGDEATVVREVDRAARAVRTAKA